MLPEGSFALPGARRQFGPSRVVDVLHIDLWLRPDLRRQALAGICTLTVSAVDAPVARLDLDAVDLLVDGVADSGGPLGFEQRNGTLAIVLRRALQCDERTTVAVTYRIEKPRRGLYFVGPSDAYSEEPLQCWTHGHAGTARYWFPCIDDPHQRQSSTMTIEVERGLFALANGALTSRHEPAGTGTTVFGYTQPRAHCSYLFTMVVGRFTELAQSGSRVPVFAYVTPGREADAARTFGDTPKMIEVLERFTGHVYPYARYSQIAVARFPFIGMENTTAATFTDEWLIEQRVLASPAVEALVVHELAHQWFGNLLSSYEWTDMWLNEGFASYCEAIWDEAKAGWNGYLYTIFCQVKTYVAEAVQRYTRPIMCDYFRDPIDIFDKHLYEKASAVLHMLRGILGDTRFNRTIARYVNDNAGKGIETVDLIRAIEVSTGRNMRAFVDQWLRRSGHPKVTVTFEFDVDRRLAQLHFTQRQLIDAAHPAYRFTLAVGFMDELPDELPDNFGPGPLAGERRISVDIDAARSAFTIALDRSPALIRIDPGAWTLGEFELELGTDLACAALACDPDPIARIRAAQALAREGCGRALNALTTAMTVDRFWGARVQFAAILGETRAPWARTALLRAVADPDAQVRRAVCAALGNYCDAEVAGALRRIVSDEPAVEVVGEALHALGKTRDLCAADLSRALNDRSWCDVIGGGALLGLAEIGDEPALFTVCESLAADSPSRRRSALRALPVLAEHRPVERSVIVRHAIEALGDPIAMTRLSAIQALDRLADTAAVGELERMAQSEPIPWIRSHAERAAVRLRSAAPTMHRIDNVIAVVETLQSNHERLRERVDNSER